ncbi:MAG: winged helix DNA-binding protein, partial [Acidobacteria bacterium]|nr:winged helix DNA-binding protein [Acidobacteriota bacterium]
MMGSAHAFASVVNDAVEKHLLEKVGGARLTFPQLSLLLLLARKQSWTISDVATFLRVSNAAASQFVDRLVRHHFLQRHEGTTDRRIAQVSLTERSRRLVQHAQRDSAALERADRIGVVGQNQRLRLKARRNDHSRRPGI